jgi:hypothetical protein
VNLSSSGELVTSSSGELIESSSGELVESSSGETVKCFYECVKGLGVYCC